MIAIYGQGLRGRRLGKKNMPLNFQSARSREEVKGGGQGRRSKEVKAGRRHGIVASLYHRVGMDTFSILVGMYQTMCIVKVKARAKAKAADTRGKDQSNGVFHTSVLLHLLMPALRPLNNWSALWGKETFSAVTAWPSKSTMARICQPLTD
jgi:hypothetical protein